MNGEYIGTALFHFWQEEPRDRARKIFISIMTRGFLLTTTNRGALDSFTVRDGDNQLRSIEVMQRPRICLTDIPFDLLSAHGAGYGRYGVGFSRETIVGWGGCPVWYLPNHHGGGTLKDNGPFMVNGLHAAMVAMEGYRALVEETERLWKAGKLKSHFVTQRFTHGKPLLGDDLLRWLLYGRDCIERALSFVKEMSPQDKEDFRYLYEREWRIVEGIQFSGKDPCRSLTDAEKSELCSLNPDWAKCLSTNDINIEVRYQKEPIINSFRFFGRLADRERVSRKIEIVAVPDENEKRWVEGVISENKRLFKAGRPEIKVFPT